MAEVYQFLKDPVEEKVSGHQKLYYFNFKMLQITYLRHLEVQLGSFFIKIHS